MSMNLSEMIEKAFHEGYIFQGNAQTQRQKIEMLVKECCESNAPKLSEHQINKLLKKENEIMEKFFWEHTVVPGVVIGSILFTMIILVLVA